MQVCMYCCICYELRPTNSATCSSHLKNHINFGRFLIVRACQWPISMKSKKRGPDDQGPGFITIFAQILVIFADRLRENKKHIPGISSSSTCIGSQHYESSGPLVLSLAINSVFISLISAEKNDIIRSLDIYGLTILT